jgi:hypothetical protein
MSKHSKTQPARESPDEMRRRRAIERAHGAGHSDYITYEEFLDLVDEDTLAEWVDTRAGFLAPFSDKVKLGGAMRPALEERYAWRFWWGATRA